MLKLRRIIGKYQEIYYMIFILGMCGTTSVALFSDDKLYKIIFVVGLFFLLLKMAVTDFTFREIAIMGLFTVLLGINFLGNGEKTLILTAMGIFGAKNVDLQKVMKIAFWEKAVLTVGFITLAAVGVVENVAFNLPKAGETIEVFAYGYEHPNNGFANLFGVVLLAVIAYWDKMKWYWYVVLTGVILVGYKLFVCRTGLVTWIVLLLMVLGYQLFRRFQKEKYYMALFPAIPLVLAVLTLVFPVLTRKYSAFDEIINHLLTGRVFFINLVYDEIWGLCFGSGTPTFFDSIYFYALYNYGWLVFVLYFVAYIVGMWYCNKKGYFHATIALGVMAVYGFMELLPLSVLWNLPLLYLSWALFKERKNTNEQLQQEISAD